MAQVYTLGPQPSSSIERNHLLNYHGGQRTDRKGSRQDPNAVCESQHSCSVLGSSFCFPVWAMMILVGTGRGLQIRGARER